MRSGCNNRYAKTIEVRFDRMKPEINKDIELVQILIYLSNVKRYDKTIDKQQGLLFCNQ